MLSFRKFFVLFIPFLLYASQVKSSEKQCWNKETFVKEIHDNWTVTTLAVFRWKKTTSRLFERYVQVNLGYQIYPSIWVSPGYRYVEERESDEDTTSKWKGYSDAVFDITKLWKWSCLEFSNRNRFQYKSSDKAWELRDLLTITYPLKIRGIKLNPFFSEEFFLEKFHDCNQNRWELGVESPINPKLKGRTSYMQKHDKIGGSWTLTTIWNIEVTFLF